LKTNKNRSGFSYIEILLALTIFSVLLMAALPLINQAGRNLAYAQEGYDAHLAAQSIMMAVRADIGNAQAVASNRAAELGAESYSVWIFSEGETISFETACAPSVDATLTGGSFFSESTYMVVAVWDSQKNLAGRAVSGILSSGD
jgi:prepilin-type N-terminal cleavage/methylation domain-containing protein